MKNKDNNKDIVTVDKLRKDENNPSKVKSFRDYWKKNLISQKIKSVEANDNEDENDSSGRPQIFEPQNEKHINQNLNNKFIQINVENLSEN